MDIKTRLTRCCGKPIGGDNCREGLRCSDCFDKLEGLREIEELREVLKPFAKIADDYETLHDEDYVSVHRHDIELRHFRAIRSVFNKSKVKHGDREKGDDNATAAVVEASERLEKGVLETRAKGAKQRGAETK